MNQNNVVELAVGDKVEFTSYTVPNTKLTGVVVDINPYYKWRDGREYTTVVRINGDDGYEYVVNQERVKKA